MLLPESSGLTCDDNPTTVTQKPDDTQECPGNETPQQLSIPGVGESTRKVRAVGKASYLTEPVRPLCDQKRGLSPHSDGLNPWDQSQETTLCHAVRVCSVPRSHGWSEPLV